MLTSWKMRSGSGFTFASLHAYTLPEVGNKVNNDSSQQITYIYCNRDQFGRVFFCHLQIAMFVFESDDFLIAALS